MERRFFIYGLTDPTTGAVRYVGKSVISLKARRSNHEYKARSGRTQTPVGAWIRALQAAGLRPGIVCLDEGTGGWQATERAWVQRLRAEGAALLNVHAGGNGAHTRAALLPKYAALLGKISDGQVATLAGLCRETITYHRRRAGIPKAPVDKSRLRGTFSKGIEAHNKKPLPAELVLLLGKVADTELAARSGLAKTTIRNQRLALGVPAFSRWPRQEERA